MIELRITRCARIALFVVILCLGLAFSSPTASADIAAPGVGLLVNNYWGRPMTLNVAFRQYTIAAYSWGFIALAPGVYDVTANAMGDDNSELNAQITIPEGKAVHMSYAWRSRFDIVAVEPRVAPVSPPSGPANTNPDQAAPLDLAWHSIDGNQSLWFQFALFSHDDEAFWLSMPNSARSGVRYEVYSADQISRWWSELPRGVGNVDDIHQVWGITTSGASAWYVRVINTRSTPAGFQFTYHGPIVTP